MLLILGTMLLRTFRLAEPYQMHFDEVYHARTATEFLQAWRYGISHDIYEWTHPHLAKYADGRRASWRSGNDKVNATSDLGVPVVAAAVEPRRLDETAPGGARRRAPAHRDRDRDPDLRPRDPRPGLDRPGRRAPPRWRSTRPATSSSSATATAGSPRSAST